MALGLAEEAVPAGTSGGAGVIITGSVVTAGEARTLLVRRMPERLSERYESEEIAFGDGEDFDDRDLFGDRDGEDRGDGHDDDREDEDDDDNDRDDGDEESGDERA